MKQRILFEAIIALVVTLLVFSLYVAYASNAPSVSVQWQRPANDTALYVHASEDGTLYTFTKDHISAIDTHGTQLWNTTIPAGLWICDKSVQPIVASDEDAIYVYARPEDSLRSGAVLALTSHGELSWELPVRSEATIVARDGRVYVFHDYNQTVLDPQGNLIFNVKNVCAPAAIDDAGRVYTVNAMEQGTLYGVDYRLPSGTIESYFSNGSLWWSHELGEPGIIQNIPGEYGSLPVYHDNTLFMPVSDGIVAMNTDGTIKWVKRYPGQRPELFGLMPFDNAGNLYLQSTDPYDDGSGWKLIVLSSAGAEVRPPLDINITSYVFDTTTGIAHNVNTFIAAYDGVGYYTKKSSPANPMSLERGDTITITAYDLLEGKDLWSYTLPSDDKTTTVLNDRNTQDLLFPSDTATSNDGQAYVLNACRVEVLPASGMTYVSFWTYSFEHPLTDKSRCAYYGGVFALGAGGDLVWHRQTTSYVTSMAEYNGTLHFATADGRVSAIKTDLPAGIAVAAVTYLLLRFVVVGAVARARDRLNKNDNRNDVLRFVVEHPGSTQYDVARALDMNLGTVRYHMMILTMNHRVAVQRVDNKYVRYFPNSNTYSRDEQVIMSLLRRDPIRRSLELLLERPGLTNIELSRALNMPESATYKYMKELMDNGVVLKESLNGKQVYNIKRDYKDRIMQGLKVLGGC